MKVELTQEDAEQVRALLLTHAEMSDQRSMKSEELHGRMKRDEPSEVGILEDLEDQVEDFTDDRNNLQRIAKLFEV